MTTEESIAREHARSEVDALEVKALAAKLRPITDAGERAARALIFAMVEHLLVRFVTAFSSPRYREAADQILEHLAAVQVANRARVDPENEESIAELFAMRELYCEGIASRAYLGARGHERWSLEDQAVYDMATALRRGCSVRPCDLLPLAVRDIRALLGEVGADARRVDELIARASGEAVRP